ncbi:MAG TPA: bis(5'-nucleosyl)-tetraphosphatase (symmetrical) YqeK [Bacillota bacterium]|nr:bis(5'-nucleosyl)-tetraphosphatase (symmetrical) YqeK [Bacillota bacterium]
MDIKYAKKIITNVLSKDRVEHSFRVAKVATQLARKYNVNIEKIELAAILHDYAKNHSKEELKRWILQSSLPKNLLFYHSAIWHGPVGALMLKQKHGIVDRDVLSAIYCHTTGKEHMSTFEKIIFVADYIEPMRDIPGVEKVREVATENLDQAVYLILRNTIQFLMSKKHTIYPSTFYAYNELSATVGNQMEVI